MTFVPDDAAICDCWSKATDEERATAYVGRNKPSFGPRGMRGCAKCHGAGFWVDERSLEAVARNAISRAERAEAAARALAKALQRISDQPQFDPTPASIARDALAGVDRFNDRH